jgi:hypothetical protein
VRKAWSKSTSEKGLVKEHKGGCSASLRQYSNLAELHYTPCFFRVADVLAMQILLADTVCAAHILGVIYMQLDPVCFLVVCCDCAFHFGAVLSILDGQTWVRFL